MLFYHTKLHCYIVVELKVVPFEPEFVGKLNFYVNAVDNLIKDKMRHVVRVFLKEHFGKKPLLEVHLIRI